MGGVGPPSRSTATSSPNAGDCARDGAAEVAQLLEDEFVLSSSVVSDKRMDFGWRFDGVHVLIRL